MAKKTVDLTLIKKLVNELEITLKAANELSDTHDYIIEVNKSTGLAAGIMSEAGLLMGDIQSLLQPGTATAAKNDFLDKLLGGLKGSGTNN